MLRFVTIFLSGVVFAIGLGISGMTQPTKVIGFLDIFGDWDPSLIFVMGGAVGVNLVLYRLTMRRARPLLEPEFVIPSRRKINTRLLSGSALFGVGWGLGGYCPGPGLVAAVTLLPSVLAFVGAMLVGMFLFDVLQKEEPRPAPETEGQPERGCG